MGWPGASLVLSAAGRTAPGAFALVDCEDPEADGADAHRNRLEPPRAQYGNHRAMDSRDPIECVNAGDCTIWVDALTHDFVNGATATTRQLDLHQIGKVRIAAGHPLEADHEGNRRL